MPKDHEPRSAGEQAHFQERRVERTEVRSKAQLRHQSWFSVEVKVRDVSRCGFMVECAQPVQIGSYVSLDVPGVGPVRAQVRWQIGGRMGGMFLDPISLDQCEWIAEQAEPQHA